MLGGNPTPDAPAATSLLYAGEQVDFVYLRKILNLTDGNLGAHLAKLGKQVN